jgi:NADPH-dependent ferric siderophore reductase
MMEVFLEELDRQFPNRTFVTVQEIADFLTCETVVIYNWNKRNDPKRRPPAISVGRELRFPKRLFAKWLAEEQRYLNEGNV